MVSLLRCSGEWAGFVAGGRPRLAARSSSFRVREVCRSKLRSVDRSTRVASGVLFLRVARAAPAPAAFEWRPSSAEAERRLRHARRVTWLESGARADAASEHVGSMRARAQCAGGAEGLGVPHRLPRPPRQGAIQALATACRLRPNDHTVWNKLGATLANSGQSERVPPRPALGIVVRSGLGHRNFPATRCERNACCQCRRICPARRSQPRAQCLEQSCIYTESLLDMCLHASCNSSPLSHFCAWCVLCFVSM